MKVNSKVAAHARHKKVKRQTKGMQKTPRSSYKLGKQAVVRSLQYSYRDRRNRKRDFRRLWITRINAAARMNGTTYSKLTADMNKTGITIDRKVLAELAFSEPEAFTAVVKAAQK